MRTRRDTGLVAADPSRRVARRLRPLQVGVGLQNLLLWVPVEKLFMTQIGFDAASIGLVAAVYAAVVPVLEIPSGLFADRWSRTGVLQLATLALGASSLVGGLSTGPAMYLVAAALLGVFFALDSGLTSSIVYDTVVEETGSGEDFPKWMGRLELVEAATLVLSAVLGGAVAALVSARFTYFATVPLVAGAALAFRHCDEPRLHRVAERLTYRRQAAATMRALAADASIVRVVLLSATTAVVAQVVFEFGPLSLLSLHAPAAVYGFYWAALVSTIGVGAWLGSRIPFHRSPVPRLVAVAALVASVAPIAASSLSVVIVGQVVVALTVAILGVRAAFLLHEAVAANVRAGVSSAAGTLAWLVFIPVSLLFGWLSKAHGVRTADWLLVGITAALAVLSAAARGGQAEDEREGPVSAALPAAA